MDNYSVLFGKKLAGGGGGGSATLIDKDITANGTYNARSDNADGFRKVVVGVPNTYTLADEGKVVDSGALEAQTSKSIDANGTYNTTLNNEVVVAVPNSYSAGDEGKVVSSGALVSQTAYPSTIMTNGTYDTTLYNSVNIAVGEIIRNDVEYKDVNFYDYEGTRVYSYTKQEFLALTEMPSGLTYDDLTFVDWNFTLSEAQTFVTNYHYLNVGAYVTPKNHNFIMRISIPIDSETVMTNLRATRANTTITINWGDNSTADVVTTTRSSEIWTPQHSYTNKGDYEITIDVTDNCDIGKLLYHPTEVIFSHAGSYVNEIYPSAKVRPYNYVPIGSMYSYIDVLNDVCNLKIMGVYSNTMSLPSTINTALYYFTGNTNGTSLPHTLHRFTTKGSINIYTTLPYIEDLIFVNGAYSTQNFASHCTALQRLVWTGLGNNNHVGSLFSSYNNCNIITAVYNTNPYTGYVSAAGIQYCATLQHITFTKNVTQIGTQSIWALSGCVSLKSITFEGTTPPNILYNNPWSTIPTTCVIYVPSGYLSAYTSASNYPDPNTYTYVEYDP